ncbi:tudor domain-containing protein 5-like [Haemaphysalis longicornis]
MASRQGSEELETIKAVIRALLIANRRPLTLRQFLQAFRTSEGQELPYRQHGFRDPLSFLQSLPDTVRLTKASCETEFHIRATVTEDVRHVQNLVSRQKGSAARGGHQPSTVKSSNSFSRPPPTTQTSARPHRSPRSKTSVELESIKSNLHLLLSRYVTNGINLLQLEETYASKFGNHINYSALGYDTIDAFVLSMPDILCATRNAFGSMRLFPNRRYASTPQPPRFFARAPAPPAQGTIPRLSRHPRPPARMAPVPTLLPIPRPVWPQSSSSHPPRHTGRPPRLQRAETSSQWD